MFTNNTKFWFSRPMEKTARRRNFVILPKSQHSNDIAIKSKSLELENWKPFNVYHVVPDEE